MFLNESLTKAIGAKELQKMELPNIIQGPQVQCCGSLDNLLQFRFLIWKSSIVSQKVVGSGSKSGSGMNYGSVCIKAKSCGSGSTKLPR